MKNHHKLFIIIAIASLLACEKNDPLGDQGELTGNVVPFVLLAQMPDAPAGDTLSLRTVAWAVNDDIETIALYHRGFKLRNYEVKLSVRAIDNVVHELSATFREDTLFTPSTMVGSFPEQGKTLNDYYQTLENAYVVVHDFVVPVGYALSREKDKELILAMNDMVYANFTGVFSKQFNRNMMVAVFPEINRFSLTYFKIDGDGFYTGELTDAGVKYIEDNLSKELMKDLVREAKVEDNTRVTIESVATLRVTHNARSSVRTFRVL